MKDNFYHTQLTLKMTGVHMYIMSQIKEEHLNIDYSLCHTLIKRGEGGMGNYGHHWKPYCDSWVFSFDKISFFGHTGVNIFLFLNPCPSPFLHSPDQKIDDALISIPKIYAVFVSFQLYKAICLFYKMVFKKLLSKYLNK